MRPYRQFSSFSFCVYLQCSSSFCTTIRLFIVHVSSYPLIHNSMLSKRYFSNQSVFCKVTSNLLKIAPRAFALFLRHLHSCTLSLRSPSLKVIYPVGLNVILCLFEKLVSCFHCTSSSINLKRAKTEILSGLPQCIIHGSHPTDSYPTG